MRRDCGEGPYIDHVGAHLNPTFRKSFVFHWFVTDARFNTLSCLVAGDSAICGRLAALILQLRPASLRFEEFRSPVKRGGMGLRFSNRSGLRPAAIWICGHKPKFRSHSGIGCDFGAGWSCGWRCDPNRYRFAAAGGRPLITMSGAGEGFSFDTCRSASAGSSLWPGAWFNAFLWVGGKAVAITDLMLQTIKVQIIDAELDLKTVIKTVISLVLLVLMAFRSWQEFWWVSL